MPPRAFPAALIAVLATIAGCGGGSDSPAAGEGRVKAATASRDPAARKAATGVGLKRIGTFSAPVYVTAPPGDQTRLFVVEQAGRIRLMREGQLLNKVFLDIRSSVEAGGERGLLSMAFPPNYASSGLFYVYFTDHSGDIRVRQYRRSSNPDAANPGSGRDVIRIGHRTYPNHNGGQLQFGPDGMLYVGFGDGGGGGDPFSAGQRLDTLLAKLIRIDPRPGGGYRIPKGNPFAGRPGARPAIWSYGLRNPYRFSFDRKTGDLTIGDVGQNEYEEVDFRRDRGRGINFGWSVWEGFKRYRSGSAPGAVKPKLAPSHSDGFCALIGGYVVRDARLPLAGRYIYGDNCNPRIYSVRLTPQGAEGNRATALQVSALSSFGEDARGRVYATSLNGGVYRFVPR